MNLKQAVEEIKRQESELLEEARFGGIAERKVIDSYDRYLRNSKIWSRELVAIWQLYKEGKL